MIKTEYTPGVKRRVSVKNTVYRMNQTEPVRAMRAPRKQLEVTTYSKLVVPVSMRSIYWQFFGFPATSEGEIISRTRIVCILCRGQIAYNRNTSNLRMHLQNKHIQELTEIESSATPRTCKSRVLRRTTGEFLDTEDGQDQDDTTEYYTEGTSGGAEDDSVLDISEIEASQAFFYPAEPKHKKVQVEKKQEKQTVFSTSRQIDVRSDDHGSSQLVTAITTYIVLDLELPEIVNGRGFQRLLVNIENPASVPSKPMVVNDILPKLYNQTKAKLLDELHELTSYMSVTLEEWESGEGRWYVTACAYYPNSSCKIICKVLTTFAFLPEMNSSTWESILASIFQEWNIVSDRVSAVVCSMEREAMVDAIMNLGFTPLPCLSYTIKECVRQCFGNEVIHEIIGKIRNQVALLNSNPLTVKSVREHREQQPEGSSTSSRNASVPMPLVMDVDGVWLTTLHMLETALQWKDASQKILDFVLGPPLCTDLKVTDDEWDIIQDLVNVLQPLKMTLISVSEEKVPLVSLVRPMVWQVIENKLNMELDESETSLNLKKAIVNLLNYRYMDERVTALLDTATIVDPRFKLLSHYSESERERMGEVVHNAIKDIIVHTIDPEDEVSDTKRMSNMALLLGQLQQNKVKVDPESSTRLEYQTYLSQSNAALDADPVQWWQRQRDKFPRLGHLADKYFCIPAVTSLPGKRSADAMLHFHLKRSVLPADLIDPMLFLHINYGLQ